MKTTTKLWLGILLLALLSPLGLILPQYFHAGSAWGEWKALELGNLISYLPKGLVKLAGLWNAALPDYGLGPGQKNGMLFLSFNYILSAVIGIAVTVIVALLIGKKLTKKGN